jgi:hypothetical protein
LAQKYGSVRAEDSVVDAVASNGSGLPHLTVERLEQKIPNKKILCVFDPHSTDLRDSLRRAALPDEVLNKFFTFLPIPAKRNSSLVSDIKDKFASRHTHVLCAYDGSANIRHGITESITGPNFVREKARDAVDDFCKWLNGSQKHE